MGYGFWEIHQILSFLSQVINIVKLNQTRMVRVCATFFITHRQNTSAIKCNKIAYITQQSDVRFYEASYII